MNNERFAAVILAAGSSSRFLRHCSTRTGGIKKEFQKLNDEGLTVLGSSVKTFAAVQSIKTIVIAVSINEEAAARDALPSDLSASCDLKILFVNGGDTRRASVINALSALVPFNPRYVLIHDGARPWVSLSLVENIIVNVKKHGAVIPLLPLTDTPKEISGNGEEGVFVKRHIKRAAVGIAQTPQAFEFPEILHAHEKAALVSDEEFTDDAEIWDRFCASDTACGKTACIPGERENRKITFIEDLI